MTASTAETAGALALASKLFDTGTVDTVYRDIYLHRARTVLTGVFSVEEFRGIELASRTSAFLLENLSKQGV